MAAKAGKKASHSSSTGNSSKPMAQPPKRPPRRRFLLGQDHRAWLPPSIARFTGYRPPESSPPYSPLPFFPFNSLLPRISIYPETLIFSTIGAFVNILILEAISVSHSTFRDVFHTPFVVASFGATAVLIFGVIESPLAQPRNTIGGHVISALVGVILTRLFSLNKSYMASLDNEPHGQIHGGALVNGALSMSLAFLAMQLTGTTHPPAGATALMAATNKQVAQLSWKYIAIVLVLSLVSVAWAVVINNLGRRRYPIYWWKPNRTFVVEDAPMARDDEEIALGTGEDNNLRQAEDGGRSPAGLAMDRLQGQGGTERDIQRSLSASSGMSGRPAHHPISGAT